MTDRPDHRPPWAAAELARYLTGFGLEAGDTVMVHAGLRGVGPMLNGPDTLIAALREVLGPEGTLMAYTDWNAEYEAVLDKAGRVPDRYRDEIAPFDPLTARACRDYGTLPEFIRTTPGACRSANPGAACAAVGARADFLTRDHPLDYGYGEHSPFARLCEIGGKVLMIGCPLDAMTLLHHAEHLAALPGKRIKRAEVPLLIEGHKQWRTIEEFDTSDPVIPEFEETYFAAILSDALATGIGRTGFIGNAESFVFPAAETRDFGVRWMEEKAGNSRG